MKSNDHTLAKRMEAARSDIQEGLLVLAEGDAACPKTLAGDLFRSIDRFIDLKIEQLSPDGASFDAYERLCLRRALEAADGNKQLAATALGIGMSTMYKRLRKHGMEF